MQMQVADNEMEANKLQKKTYIVAPSIDFAY